MSVDGNSLSTSELNEIWNIEQAIERAGYGLFQRRLLVVCGLVFMSDSMEIMLLSFLQVLVRKDWNLTTTQEASITAAVFIGELPGAMAWGMLGDMYGRKISFILSAVFVALFGVISAFSNSFEMLLLCRGLVGFGVAGGLIPFDILAEFSTNKQRGRVLISTGFFWTLGTLLVAVLAWLVVEPWGWRGLTACCSAPLIIAIACVQYLPESPRWLIDKRKFKEALSVLKEVSETNGVTFLQSENNVINFGDEDCIENPKSNSSSPRSTITLDISTLPEYPSNQSQVSMMELFSPSLIYVTMTFLIIWFGFGLTYYGYSL